MPTDPDLQYKADLLRSTPLFTGADDGYFNSEKSLIFLAAANLKPVSAASSGHWQADSDGRHRVADDLGQVEDVLRRFGLHSMVMGKDEFAITVAVSLDRSLLEQLAASFDSHKEIGRLFGYPPSAVEAFDRGQTELMSMDDQEAIERELGLWDGLANFRCSRLNAHEELQTAVRWQEALIRYGFGNGTTAPL